MKNLFYLSIFIALFSISCSTNEESVLEENLTEASSLKPVAGNYTVTSSVSEDGFTLTFVIDQSSAKDVSHVLLQAQDCSGNYMNSGNVVSYSSDAVVSYTTGAGTGCAFDNSSPFIKFDDSELMPVVNGKITYSITFNTKVSTANILIKSGSKNQGAFCFPFTLNFANKCNQTVTCGDETGFAYGNSYAIALNSLPNIDSNRWGWVNGPLSYDMYDFPIYAGAGNNVLSNGTIVGNAHLDYNAIGIATVTITYISNYTNTESAVYIGSANLPVNPMNNKTTVAPGQYQKATIFGITGSYSNSTNYSSIYSKSGETYTITGLSGNIYLIVHTAGTLCD